MSQFSKNLSEGSVVKQLLIFAIPFILSNFVQSLYSIADMVIVGQFSGTISMSGVNIGGQVTQLVTNLVIGLSTGATVLIAQYLGAKNDKALSETITTLFTTLIVLALVLTGFMLIAKGPILRLIQTPIESFSEANIYLTITALGTFFIFGYNALSSVMRGMGNSKVPLVFVTIACAVNVILDIVLIKEFDMSAKGAAIATIISQAVSMALCIIYLKKKDFVFDFRIKSFKFNPHRLKMLLKIGIPTSVQNVVAGMSFILLTAMVNTIGLTESAAVGAVGKFNGFAILPAIAMSSAISVMSAQNFGANEEKRAVKTMKIGTLIGFLMSFTIFILAWLFPEDVIRVFSNDEDLIKAGCEYLSIFKFDYLFAPILFGFSGMFIGAGHTTFSLIVSLASSIFIRVPMAYLFGIKFGMGIYGVALGAPLATLFALIMCIIFYLSGKWKDSPILAH